jgi:subtilisin family serine protease
MSKRHTFALALLLLSSTAAVAQERVSVMIELDSPPAVESYLRAAGAKSTAGSLRAAVAAARSQLAVVEAQQLNVVQRLEALPSIAVLYRVQRVFNGIAADVDASQLEAIAKMPGVKSVQPLEILKVDNSSSVPLIGGPDVWRALAPRGATGKGVKVGIIDTGLDYIHRDFGGNGDYAGKTFTGSTFPTTEKVPGGVDLAGDDYDPGSSTVANRTPKPDGDPMDCAGHGSHVAGTIGGFGVKKDKTTYTGPYNVPFDSAIFSIGPGVAPEAKLYPIRIFGCTGATGLTTAGLEWAIDPNKDGDFSDHMDVVNLSLGSGFGSKNSSSSIAADNLARAGCVVVAASGNAGDTYYITSSPAAGEHVLSVAASVDALEPADALQIDAPSSIAANYVAHHAVNFGWSGLTTPLKGTIARPAAQLTGCSSFPVSDRALITGKIALLDWSDNDCGSATRVNNATTAGAVGVILRHTRNELDIAIAGGTGIPSTLVTQATGDLILANLGGGVTATLSTDLLGSMPIINPANSDLMASFSSRGPRIDDNGLKPEITAPGFTVWSVLSRSGYRGTSLSGTSMATPMTAGAVALIKQIHPDWTSDELKALIMSTANHDLFTGTNHSGDRYSVSRVGAGRVDVASAARSKGFEFIADAAHVGAVGGSFGSPDVVDTYSETKAVVVLNKGSGTITTYRVSYDAGVTQPGVTFTFPAGDSVSVPPNGSASFPVKMTATAAAMRHHRDASLTPDSNGVLRSWLGEASGWVTLTATGEETLRVPVFAAPRPASAMSAVSPTFNDSASGTFPLKLKGTTLGTGSGLEDENATLGAFELANVGGRNTSLSPQFNIKYTGIATDFGPAKAVNESTIYFAVAMFGPWTTPFQTSVRIDIDTNGDGVDDFRVTTADLATFTSSTANPSDVFIASLCTSAGANCKRTFLNGVDPSVADMVLFNTNVLILPVRAADLGLAAGKSSFTYRIRTGISSGIDTMPRQSYDVAKPGMSFSGTGGVFGFFDTPSNTINVAYDKTAFAAAKSRGILLLHLHNALGSHEEIVTPPGPTRHRAVGH